MQRIGNGPPPLQLSDPVPGNFLDTSAISTTNLAFNSRWPDFEAATVTQWNVATEYLLSGNSTLEVAYVGNKGSNLDVTLSPNNTPWGVDGSVIANRPFPQYGTLGMRAPLGASDYNALQTKLERRFTGSWYGLVSYTFADGHSEAPTFGAGGGGFQSYDWSAQPIALPILESAFMEQLTRHRLSVSTIARLPVGRGQKYGSDMHPVLDAIVGGWQTQMVVTAKSGLPINVTLARTGTDPYTGRSYAYLASSGGGELRPNLVGDPLTGNDPKDDRVYLDINGFAMPAAQHARQRAEERHLRPRLLERRHRLDQALHLRWAAEHRPPHRSVQRLEHGQLPQPGRRGRRQQLRPDPDVVRPASNAAGVALRVLVMTPQIESTHVHRDGQRAAGGRRARSAQRRGADARTEVPHRAQRRSVSAIGWSAARGLLERRRGAVLARIQSDRSR